MATSQGGYVNGGFDLGLHAPDEFAVGVDQGLLGFDFGDDGQ